jgi:heme/copper-type cytochrome/quinol oxidase subunit 2
MSNTAAIAITLLVSTVSLPVFGAERIAFWRERARGASPASYFIANRLAFLPLIALLVAVFLSLYGWIAPLHAPLYQHYMVLFPLALAASSLGFLVSLLVPQGMAVLVVVCLSLTESMFSGARPTLPEFQAMTLPLHWMCNVSYLRWAQEALYLVEAHALGIEKILAPALVDEGYHWSYLSLDIICIVAIGIVLEVLAYLALLYRERRKQFSV